MLEFSYLSLGFFLLLYNTVRDMKTRVIDSRFNFMAVGATIMLAAANRPGWLILGFGIFTSLSLAMLLRKHLAGGDLEAIGWVVLGMAVLNPAKVFIFLVSLAALTSLSIAISRAISKQQGLPGYVAILGSYALTAAL